MSKEILILKVFWANTFDELLVELQPFHTVQAVFQISTRSSVSRFEISTVKKKT